jgi:hypothetical protein
MWTINRKSIEGLKSVLMKWSALEEYEDQINKINNLNLNERIQLHNKLRDLFSSQGIVNGELSRDGEIMDNVLQELNLINIKEKEEKKK